MVQWSRLDKAVVARGQAQHGVLAEAVQYRYNMVQQKLRSDPLPLAWVVLLDAVDAQVNGPCLLSSVMKPNPMDQRGLCLHQSIRTCRRRWVHFLIESSLWIAAGVDTLAPSARAATQGPYRVRWVCWHGPKKSGKMAQPALEGLKCNSVSRSCRSCRSCRKSHVWSLEFSLLGLARKIRRQTIMTWGSICLVDGDWLCFFRVPDEQLCVCNVFSVLNHILG